MGAMGGQTDRASLIRSFEQGRAAHDVEAMGAAAVGLAAQHKFGTPSGRTPAYLHEAYALASGVQRIRLAVALARTWAYGHEPSRAAPFADEAVAEASRCDDPGLLADALDAQLLVHWGPDDLAERRVITSRLEDVVAHVVDVEVRLSSHLWRLTTALEILDVIGVQRQLRALEDLAEESGSARVRLFAASRRAMYCLITGDLVAARALLEQTQRAGEESGEPDAEALVHELGAGIARQSADRSALVAQAEAFEAFATAHGVRSAAAEAATLWLAAGRSGQARAILDRLTRSGLAAIPRDVDWLLTVTLLTEVAAGTGGLEVAAEGVDLLTPYAGRGVVNAGAVTFQGIVDDFLWQACHALGRAVEARGWAGSAATGYSQLGATWWRRRVDASPPTEVTASVARLYPGKDGVWSVGCSGRTAAVSEMKGFRYLRLLLERPGVPVGALELTQAVAGHPATVGQTSTGEMIDRQALAAYRRRIAELDEELMQARAWSDTSRSAALAAERGMLLDEVAAATGFAGRRRRGGGDAERARIAVRKSLAAAIGRLGDVDPELARLLRDTIRTGATCCYEPDPARPVRWVLVT